MSYHVHLGAAPATASASPSSFSMPNVEELAARIGQRVADRVSTETAKAVENGVAKITAAVGTGVDRFISSPAGEAVFNKLENKLDDVVVNTVKKRQIELALLGVAGLALFMGGGSLAAKMGPRATTTAFVVGAAALALVATGTFAPPDETLPKRKLPSR